MATTNYSLTFRTVIPSQVGMLGQVMAAIGDADGSVGGVDIVRSAKDAVTRDITVYARDEEHGEAIRRLGITRHHRLSFAPVRLVAEGELPLLAALEGVPLQ